MEHDYDLDCLHWNMPYCDVYHEQMPIEHPYYAVIDGRDRRDILSVSWDTSGICNFKCTYCDPHYHNGQDKFPALDKVVRFLTELSQGSGKSLYLEIKGGEPTYWKEMPAFLDIASTNKWGTCIVTNGSRPLPWWEENLEKIADINLSLHPEFYKEDHLFKVIDFILPRRHLYAKYLMYPPYFEECVSNIEKLRKRFPALNMEAVPVSQMNTGNEIHKYTDDQVRMIKKINSYKRQIHQKIWPQFEFEDRFKAFKLRSDNSIEELKKQNIKLDGDNNWRGWLCHAGLDRIHIGTNGDIFRGQCKQGGKLGNIHSQDWAIPNKPVTCEKKNCFCGSELLLKKWNPTKISLLSTSSIELNN